MTRAIMIQGTGSNVGKSMVVAGLCRAIKNRNLKVAPFKPQNMSNNAVLQMLVRKLVELRHYKHELVVK